MEVTVNEQDIKLGNPGCTTTCPIARALFRALGTDVSVNATKVYVWADDEGEPSAEYGLPKEAQDFVAAYDDGKRVLPFRFELDDSPREALWAKK